MIVTLIPQLQRISIACKNREHKNMRSLKKARKHNLGFCTCRFPINVNLTRIKYESIHVNNKYMEQIWIEK